MSMDFHPIKQTMLLARSCLFGNTSRLMLMLGGVNDIAFSTPNKQLCVTTCGDDKTIKVWDAATGVKRHTFEGHEAPVYSICPHYKENIQDGLDLGPNQKKLMGQVRSNLNLKAEPLDLRATIGIGHVDALNSGGGPAKTVDECRMSPGRGWRQSNRWILFHTQPTNPNRSSRRHYKGGEKGQQTKPIGLPNTT
ncbi:unnamed protein product [Arabis nemorensis]|uniref:Uncharacterized protein n=1 Tax=Arabis nemorensis TaxID=586526 RepID=A0A565AXN1_9BRAS|nr:unnamed protein product [Arabis nemorensis]